jgi:hypothetical protein
MILYFIGMHKVHNFFFFLNIVKYERTFCSKRFRSLAVYNHKTKLSFTSKSKNIIFITTFKNKSIVKELN